MLAALVEEADCLQKHKPKQHALLKEDIGEALVDVDPNAPQATAAAPAAIAGSSAAALAVLGTVHGAASGAKEGLGNKLLGVLMGRKSSTGLGEIGAPAERALTSAGSRDASCNGRISNEWPTAALTPTARAACSGTVTPTCTGGQLTYLGVSSLSRKASDCTALPPAAGATADAGKSNSTEPGSFQPIVMMQGASDGQCREADTAAVLCEMQSSSNSSTALRLPTPDPVQAKLAAVGEMLHKLGTQSDAQRDRRGSG